MILGIERVGLEQAGHMNERIDGPTGCVQALRSLLGIGNQGHMGAQLLASAQGLLCSVEPSSVHIHQKHVGASLPQLPDNPAATAVVKRARQRVMEIVASFGGGHFQLGRAYPYRESRDAASQALLDTIKGFVDQDGQLNPGSLGFPQ